jgi:hypothetical protein
LEEIAAKIAQKTKILEENAAKIVLFEKKIFFNFCSIFVKKKQYVAELYIIVQVVFYALIVWIF